MTAQTCPTPAKARYATPEAALLVAARYPTPLRTYHCPCGWHHLTSQPAPAKPREDPTVTSQVAALDDAEFTDLTGSELRGTATPAQAAALRNPINLTRWTNTLKAISTDIHQQLAARKNDKSSAAADWRRRILNVQRSLYERRSEAKQLRQQALSAAGTEHARLASLGITGPEARAAAGDRAIQRLIATHHPEFTQFLIEELEAAGLQVPTRIARHAARHTAATPDGGNEPA